MEETATFDLKIFEDFSGQKDELIPLLQKVQGHYGYLPSEAMEKVADFTGVTKSNLYGVATFYAQFRFSPIGKEHIMVCRGTACHVKGAENIKEAIERNVGIKEGEVTPDGKYSLETVACIGCCSLAPCIMVNKKVQAKMTTKKVSSIFGKGENSE